MRRLASLLVLASLCAPNGASLANASADSSAIAPPDTTTTLVYVVRHAEKSTTVIGADPPLSESGARRARTLAHVLRDANIRAIYVSKFTRTRQTADSLATRAGIPVLVVDQGDATALAQRIRSEQAGHASLVVGHGDTVPAIVTALSGRAAPPIGAGEWDVLYLVTLPARGPRTVIRLHYGDETPVARP
jgi:broad specificity phosphatase PhoE